MVKCILAEQGGKGTPLSLMKIEITTPPTKTTYAAGEIFDPTGMVVTGSYGAKDIVLVTAPITGYAFPTTMLVKGTPKITITYSESGIVCTTTQNITVTDPVLRSISFEVPTTEYEYGDVFPSTYPVIAKYSDNSTKNVNATCSNVDLNAVGNHEIALSYTDRGITARGTLTINVKRKRIAVPSLKSSYSSSIGQYKSSEYNVNSATYLNNYSSTYYTVRGNTGTAAGTYTMYCTPTSNYRWSDKTTGGKSISWKISKANLPSGIVSIQGNTVIDSDNLTRSITVQIPYDIWADITISPMSGVTGLTIRAQSQAGDRRIFEFTGDGTRTINQNFTVHLSESQNYTSGSFPNKFTITTDYKRIQLALPAQSGTLTYNGNYQTPSWNSNYNSSLMTVSVTSQKNAGTYYANFSLRDSTHYQWSDGTNGTKSVSWKIGKKSPLTSDLLLSGNTAIDSNNLTRDITIRNLTGETSAITIYPTSGVAGLTISQLSQSDNSRTFRFTGDGTTEITRQTFHVNIAEGKNHTNMLFTDWFAITASYGFNPSKDMGTATGSASLGSDATIGDDTWWIKLQEWVATSSTKQEREALVGKTKKVSLLTPILGASGATMVCIGADIDGKKTLTFQTLGVLPNTNSFSSTSALWDGSTAQAVCANFAGFCSANGAIKAITKLTSTACNDSRTNDADGRTTARGWLPSECEMGLSNSSPSSSEWTSGGIEKAYPYYSSDDRRVKKRMNSTGNSSGGANSYFTRSRAFNSYNSNNIVNIQTTGVSSNSSYSFPIGVAPAFVVGKTSAIEEMWGDETAIGKAQWWTNLRNKILAATPEERAACVGRTKKVSLSSFWDSIHNEATMICIGADIDGEKTLTFQTLYNIAGSVFGYTTDWTNSLPSEVCGEFITGCSASGSVKTITKLTCTVQNNATQNEADGEATVTCWLPSACEMGLYNVAPSNKEWTKGGAKKPYPYYSSDSRRAKKALQKTDASEMGGEIVAPGDYYQYWLRSRYYGTYIPDGICQVNSTGKASVTNSNKVAGLAPAFVIG